MNTYVILDEWNNALGGSDCEIIGEPVEHIYLVDIATQDIANIREDSVGVGRPGLNKKLSETSDNIGNISDISELRPEVSLQDAAPKADDDQPINNQRRQVVVAEEDDPPINNQRQVVVAEDDHPINNRRLVVDETGDLRGISAPPKGGINIEVDGNGRRLEHCTFC